MTRDGDLCHDNYFTGSKVGRLGVQVETYKNLTSARNHGKWAPTYCARDLGLLIGPKI